ncbi:MAG: D-glycero-beta-D-manno-heptose 1-phosphate adenylyltransferase [Saprospiraceae bacterium]
MLDFVQAKILNQSTLLPTLTRWKLFDQRIVFTNGCFDILHYGHLHYLAAAKALGDKLIIGVNATNSVKRLKGQHRPINDDLTRYHLLAALSFVDAVIEFEEDTPYKLIKKIQPNILVKGGDWQIEQIVGADLVLATGGLVKSLPFVEGYSTTNIETKIRGTKV